MAVEGFAVFEEDLLDGGPVVGVDKGQGIAGAIFIIDADDAVVDVALHVVGAAGHEQVGTGGFAFEGHLQTVGVVVPEGGEGDVMAFGGGAEGDAEFGFQYAAAFSGIGADGGAEAGVVDIGRFQGMTPFAYALHGYLQGGIGGTGGEVFVAEDIGDIGIEGSIHLNGGAFVGHYICEERGRCFGGYHRFFGR